MGSFLPFLELVKPFVKGKFGVPVQLELGLVPGPVGRPVKIVATVVT